MRRSVLPPPRPLLAPVEAFAEAISTGGGVRRAAAPPGRAVLAAPSEASRRLRRFFDPVDGWFRRLERGTSHWLARDVYPRLPGMWWPYGLCLDRYLTVSEGAAALRGLPPALDGTRVLLVTDVHVGPFLSPAALSSTFDRLRALQPDLILLGGDLTTARLDEFPPYAPAFRRLRAPLGVYGVLGNHDHYTGKPERLRRMLEDAGVRVLHNDAVAVERGDQRLILAGVDDLYCGRPDLDAALARAAALAPDAGAGPVVLLSHNPDLFFEAAARGVDLVLAGHTHGGQIRVPRLPVIVRQSRYRLDEGRFVCRDSELVISRGLGVTGLPVRWNCPPEAVLLELRATAP